MEEVKVAGESSPEQIESWKKQHNEVIELRVAQKDGTVSVGYLKPAGRNVIAVASSKHAADQVVEAGEFVLKNCWIDGDRRLLEPKTVAEEQAACQAAMLANANLILPPGTIKKK